MKRKGKDMANVKCEMWIRFWDTPDRPSLQRVKSRKKLGHQVSNFNLQYFLLSSNCNFAYLNFWIALKESRIRRRLRGLMAAISFVNVLDWIHLHCKKRNYQTGRREHKLQSFCSESKCLATLVPTCMKQTSGLWQCFWPCTTLGLQKHDEIHVRQIGKISNQFDTKPANKNF